MFETLFGIVFVTLCFVVGVAALAMPAGAFIRCGRYALSVICFAVAVLFSIGLAVFGPLPPKADIDVTVIKLGVALIFGVGGYLLWPRRRSIKYGDQLLESGEDLSELQEYVPSLRYDLDTNYRDVRAGLQQAEVGRNSWGLLLGEAAAFAWALGYYIESWDIGVIAFVVLFFFIALASYVKALGGVIALFMGCVWGIGGYYGTLHIGFNGYAALAVSILVGLIGIGVHVSGFDYVRDVNRSD